MKNIILYIIESIKIVFKSDTKCRLFHSHKIVTLGYPRIYNGKYLVTVKCPICNTTFETNGNINGVRIPTTIEVK